MNTYQGYNTTKQLSNAFRKHSKPIMPREYSNEENVAALALMTHGTELMAKKCRDRGTCGVWNDKTQTIHFMDGEYKTPTPFAHAHKVFSGVTVSSHPPNGWDVCVYKVDGEWKPLDNLREQLRRQRTTTPIVVEEYENTSEMVDVATQTPLCYSSPSSPIDVIIYIIAIMFIFALISIVSVMYTLFLYEMINLW